MSQLQSADQAPDLRPCKGPNCPNLIKVWNPMKDGPFKAVKAQRRQRNIMYCSNACRAAAVRAKKVGRPREKLQADVYRPEDRPVKESA
jgi:hypothetical protein